MELVGASPEPHVPQLQLNSSSWGRPVGDAEPPRFPPSVLIISPSVNQQTRRDPSTVPVVQPCERGVNGGPA